MNDTWYKNGEPQRVLFKQFDGDFYSEIKIYKNGAKTFDSFGLKCRRKKNML
jgi:hypothetical protein